MEEAGSSAVKVISGFSNYGQVVRQGTGETAKLSESARTLSRILKNVGLKPGQEILPVDAFRAVATQFASMEDGAQKTQLSVELFGKRIGPKLIPFLNLGAKGIEKYRQQIEALGLTATNEATSIAGRAADELAFVGFLFEQYANKFATLVAPAIIQATDAILNALATNSDRISAVLQQLASSLSSIIVDLVSILSQAPDESVSNKWLLDLRDAALAVRDTFVNVLIPAFQVIRDQAGLVATAFNTLFGTALTGDQLLVGATILKLLGIFRLLFAVVKVGAQSFMLFVNALRLIGPVGTVISRLFPVIASGIGTVLRMLPMLAAFFSPQGLIAVGVIALGALIYGFWDEIVAGSLGSAQRVDHHLLKHLGWPYRHRRNRTQRPRDGGLGCLDRPHDSVTDGMDWTHDSMARCLGRHHDRCIRRPVGADHGCHRHLDRHHRDGHSGAGWIVRGGLTDLGCDHRGGQRGCDNDPADLGWDCQRCDDGSDRACRSCAPGLVGCNPGCRCQCRGDQGGNRPCHPDCR